MKKRLISLLLVLSMVFGLMSLSGCEFKSKYITRGEWITMLSETFGMDSYTEDTPAYSDVTSDSNIFTYVQSAAEWNVLSIFDGEEIDVDKAVTRKEIASTAAIAAGYKSEDDKFNVDGSVAFAIEKGIIPEGKRLSKRMTLEDCETALNAARTAYLNAPIEERMVVVTNNNVIDMTNLSGEQIEVSESKVTATGSVSKDSSGKLTATIETPTGSAKVSVGEVFITPPTPENPAGIAHKVAALKEVDGEIVIGTEPPTLADLYEELDINTTVEADPDNIIWAPVFSGSGASGVSYNGGKAYHLDVLSTRYGAPKIVPMDSDSYSSKFHKDFEFGKGNFENNWSNKTSSDIGAGKGAQALNNSNFVYDKKPSIEDFKGKTDSWEENLKVENKFSGGYKISGYIDINSITVSTSVDYKRSRWLKIPYGVKNASVQVSSDITSYLKLEGTLKEELKIGTIPIPIAATGLSVSVDLYLYVTASGTLEVKATAGCSAKVEYSDGRLRKTADTHMDATVDATIEVDFGADVSATLDALGIIKIVDAGVKVGGNLSASAHVSGSCKVSEENGVTKLTYQEAMAINVDLYVPLVKVYAGGNKKTLIGSLGIGGTWNMTTKNKGAKHITLVDEEWVFWEETVLKNGEGDVTGGDSTTAGEEDGVGATDSEKLDFMAYVITLKDDSKRIELDLDEGEKVPAVVWASDNTSIATVDGNGIVTPVSRGYTIITAYLMDDPSVQVKCAVYVEKFGEKSNGGSSGENDDWEFLPPDMPTAA